MTSDMNSISSITNSEEGANSGQQPDKETEVQIKPFECETPNMNTSDLKGNESLSAYGEVDTRLISSNSTSHLNPSSLTITKNEDDSVDLDTNRKRSRPSSWEDSNTNLLKRSRVQEVIVLDNSDDSDCESQHNGEELQPWQKQSTIESSCAKEKNNVSASSVGDTISDQNKCDARASKDASATNHLNATNSTTNSKDVIDLLCSEDDEENDSTSDILMNQAQQDRYACKCIDLTANDSDVDVENDISEPKSTEKITYRVLDSKSKRGLDIYLLDDSDIDEESDKSAKPSSEIAADLENVSDDRDTKRLTSTKIHANESIAKTHKGFAFPNCIAGPVDEDSEFENLDDALLQNGKTLMDKTEIESLQSKPDTIQKETAIEKSNTNGLQSTSVFSKESNSSMIRHIRKILPPKKTTSTTATLPRHKTWQKKSMVFQTHYNHHMKRPHSENVFELRCHQEARSLLEDRVFLNDSRILPIEPKDRSHCTYFFYYVAKSYCFDAQQKSKAICLYCSSFSTKSHIQNPHFLGNHILNCSKVPHDEKEALRILEGSQKSERKLSTNRFNHKDVINRILYRIDVRKNDKNEETSSRDSERNKISDSDSHSALNDSFPDKDNIESQGQQMEPILRRSRRCSTPNYTSSDDESFSSLSTTKDPFADFDSFDQMIHQSYKAHTSKIGLPSRWITVQNYSTAYFFDFKITTGPSSIENAGNGAFIELVRVRKAQADENPEKPNIFETVALTQLALTAKIDEKNVTVRLGPSSIHDFDNALKETAIKEDKIPFCSRDKGNGSIFLGKYGPFFQEDIKTDFLYDIKNLIFDSEPSVWSYGLSKSQNKSNDNESPDEDDDVYVLDITSDTTGMVHTEATKHIPMYVNEVGNNRSLRPNVTPRDELIDGEVGVSYYFFTDRPIYPGEKHELLVDYQGTYEETRERKGYGKSGVGSDKEDESARVRRNMSTRLGIEVSIRCNSHTKIVDCLFDMEQMTKAIIQSTDESLKRFEKSTFSPLSDVEIRMWIARFRLNWVFDLFIQLRPLLGEDFKIKLKKMKHVPCKSFLSLVETNEKLLRAYKYELLEEHVFLASKGQFLVHPMDRSLFCPIARDIVKRISENVGLKFRTYQIFGKSLVEEVLEVALEAVTEVRTIAKLCSQEMDHKKLCEMLRRLGFEVEDENSAHHTLTCSMPHLTVSGAPALERIDENGDSVRVRWIKKSESEDYEIDFEWYLLFQVVKVVHILATKCFIGIEKYGYTLTNLCRKVGVSFEMARTVVTMVMTEPYGETFQLFANDDIDIGSNNKKNIKRTVASKSTAKKGMSSFCYSDGLFSRYWKVDTVSIPF